MQDIDTIITQDPESKVIDGEIRSL